MELPDTRLTKLLVTGFLVEMLGRAPSESEIDNGLKAPQILSQVNNVLITTLIELVVANNEKKVMAEKAEALIK